ncbi:MAG: hypothetical protein GY842_00685, partial [bacterium]|nr:hypothetical protein [bacterium]
CLIFGNNVTRLFILLVAFTVANGYWLGASRVAAAFGGMIAAVVLALPLGKACAGAMGAVVGTTGLTNRMVSIGVAAVIVAVVITIGLQVALNRALKRRPAWKEYDRPVGAGIGLFEGVLLGFVVLWAVLVLEPGMAISLARSDGTSPSAPMARCVSAVAAQARASILGRLAGVANPLAEMRLIALSQ